MTQDMFDHAAEYFEACRRIRRVRKDILRELGTAIIKFLEGQEAPDGIIPLEIRERLGTLAAVLRIETIIKDNRWVPAYMTNRPLQFFWRECVNMGIKSEMIKARDEFIALVKAKLFTVPDRKVCNPDAEHELITTVPEKRYSIGILFPKENKMQADGNDVDRAVSEDEKKDVEQADTVDFDASDYIGKDITVTEKDKKTEDETDDDPDSEDNLDEEVSLAAQNMPSSFGITFFVRGNTDRVRISLKYGTYRDARMEDCRIPFTPSKPGDWSVPEEFDCYVKYDREERTLRLTGGINRKAVRQLKERDLLGTDEDQLIDNLYKLADQLQGGYVREPRELNNYEIVFGEGDYVNESHIPDHGLVEITALRRKMENGTTALTILVVNAKTERPQSGDYISNRSFGWIRKIMVFRLCSIPEPQISIFLMQKNNPWNSSTETSMYTEPDSERRLNWKIDDSGTGFMWDGFTPELKVIHMDFALPDDSGVNSDTVHEISFRSGHHGKGCENP